MLKERLAMSSSTKSSVGLVMTLTRYARADIPVSLISSAKTASLLGVGSGVGVGL